jgi:hypothetical protein
MKKILEFLILTTFTLVLVVFPISKISAESPELNMTLFSEQLNGSTGKVAWVITFTSTGISEGTHINITLSESGKIIETKSVTTDKEGKGTYYTENTLNPSTKYNIVAVVKNPALTAFLERTIPATATDNQNLPTVKFTPVKDNAINVDTQKSNSSNDTHKYTLLAPFAGFTEAPENVGDYLNKIFIIAIGLCSALAVLMIIIAGVQYMGEESIFTKVNAKKQIQNALFGLLIALSAYALLNTIDPRLLGKGGVNIRAVTGEIDLEVHGDDPHSPINGKYCNGKYSAKSPWQSDAKEREKVEKVGITVNKSNCTEVGQSNCTSLAGLNTSSVINLKKTCPSCEIIITGGTECWLHSQKTQHLPGNSIVDLSTTSSLISYIEKNNTSTKVKNTSFVTFVKNGAKFMREPNNHYHIINW